MSASLYAQPTLTSAIVPVIGNTITSIQSDTAFSEGPSGASQTWNFSGFTNTGNYSSVYVNPSTTAYTDSITGSNLAANTPGSTAYFNSTSSILELLGLGTVAYVVIYSDPVTYYTLPFTYNSTVSDNNAGHYVYGAGFYDTRTGTSQTTGDAYGTVTTPIGTFGNVLRVKMVQQTMDVTSFSTSNSTVTSYSWYAPTYNNALAQISYTVGDVGGSPYSVKSVTYGDVTPQAVININNLNHDLFIADLNNNEYTIQLQTHAIIKSVEVIDMQGKVVTRINSNDASVLINLNEYAGGIYFARILDTNNRLYQTKLLR